MRKLVIYALEREDAPTRRLLSETPYMAPASSPPGVTLSCFADCGPDLDQGDASHRDVHSGRIRCSPAPDQLLFRVPSLIVAHGLFGWAAALIDRAYVTWAPVKFATFLLLVCTPADVDEVALSHCVLFSDDGNGRDGAYSLFCRIFTSDLGTVYISRGCRSSRGSEPPAPISGAIIWPWVAISAGRISPCPRFMWQQRFGLRSCGAPTAGSPVRGLCLFFADCDRLVLLGWHYAVDGIAAALITAASWKAAKWLLRPGAFDFRAKLSKRLPMSAFDRQGRKWA